MSHHPAFSQRRPIIGVLASWQVYAGTLNTLLSPILRGICDTAQQRECNILLACGVVSDFSAGIRTAWPLLTPEVDFLPVGAWNTDGLIIIAPIQSENAQARYIRELQQAGHPLVFAETSEMRPAVCLDNAGGIRQALDHLRSHGHKHIAFIGGEEGRAGDGLERLQAYSDYCRAHDLPQDPRLVAYGKFTAPGGYAAMQQILASGVTFTAVLASNDESAAGAMQALREAGRRVPQDVAIIGFDNRFEARNQTPPLTTINQPAYEIGRQSLELMLLLLAGQITQETIQRVSTQLVIRETCGCAPGASSTESLPANTSREEWVNAISAAVFSHAGQLHSRLIQTLSAGLVDGFLDSIAQQNETPFHEASQAILAQLEPLNEDAHAWQVAIRLLRQNWLAQNGSAIPDIQVLEWLDKAHLALSECAQHQLLRYFDRQNQSTQQLSLMSAELSEAIEISQLQSILDRFVPNMGIRHARLVLFEPDSNDPVAWSLLPGAESTPWRFPTRSFPPANLYPDEPPWQLALLPLLVQKKISRVHLLRRL